MSENLDRLNNFSSGLGSTAELIPAQTDSSNHGRSREFFPAAPESFREAGLTDTDVQELVLKYLLIRGTATGREIAKQIKLPFILLDNSLRKMKRSSLIRYCNSASVGDYSYELIEAGSDRARRLTSLSSYCGPAPVSLRDYIHSVQAQSLERRRPSMTELEAAVSDLVLSRNMLKRLGSAVHSGRGMFLYGSPGNGKTSIAERLIGAFGPYVWIPRSIVVDREIIRIFDPVNHEVIPEQTSRGILNESEFDRRWVRIRRPTIVAGGELTMNNLEITYNEATGICEAPLQMKSNCGALVIDDFGRQRMSIDALLNRWIVPLEKRCDFLNLANGKKVLVPFNQLIIFSTNLEPRSIVDDAFLRRIPYKIEVVDPTEGEFRQLFQMMCRNLGFQYDDDAVTHVIEKHYKDTGRPFRCCQPRDLLAQVRDYCSFEQQPLNLTPGLLDIAAESYFSVM